MSDQVERPIDEIVAELERDPEKKALMDAKRVTLLRKALADVRTEADCAALLRRAESAERQRDEAIADRERIRLRFERCNEERERQHTRADEAIAALRELVRLKDLHDAIEKDQAMGSQQEGARDYYNARKLIAWESARRLLNQKDIHNE